MFAVAATSTGAQLLAMFAFGVADLYEWGWSTGGLVALVASIYFGTRCDSWEDFSRRIWTWVAITAVLAFLVMGYNASMVTGDPSMGASLGFRI